MKRIIFHVDVNNAFLSWTAVDMLKNGSKLDIRTIPSVIGGDEKERRGIVVARSYPAKKLGINAGDSIYLAKRKINKLFVASVKRELFINYSNAFYKILCKYCPVVERYSIDECFLDMTGTNLLYNSILDIAYKIKEEIKNDLGFTVNVGIGNSKLCAKMASDFEKPDKVHTLFDDEVKEKMWPLSVDNLIMVGKSSSKKLHELGIHTIKDLALIDENILLKHFKSMGHIMHEYANGIDLSPIIRQAPKNQGIGNSTTLPQDVYNLSELKKILMILSNKVGVRLRNEKKYATTVAVKLKNSNFISYVHQKKLISPISTDEDIFNISLEILKSMWKGDPIRLIGIRVSDFSDTTFKQISLFDDVKKYENREKVQKTLDDINNKFGNNTIINAALLKKEDN